MPELDREGIFKAVPRGWGVKKNDSGALQFSVLYDITDKWESGEWVDYRPYSYSIYGNHVVVKKDGGAHDTQIKNLRSAFGWDGALYDLHHGDWSGIEVKLTVKSELYEGKTRVVVAWVNPVDGGGSYLGNVNDDVLRQLDQQYGGQIRALGTPGKPKRVESVPAATEAPAMATAGVTAAPPDDEFPFLGTGQ